MNNKIFTDDFFNRLLFIPNNTFFIIGTNNKNYIIKDILYLLKDISFGVVMSTNQLYDSFFHKNLIFPTFNQKVIDKLIKRQKTKNNNTLLIIDTNNNKLLLTKSYFHDLIRACEPHNITLLFFLDDLIDVKYKIKTISYVLFLKEINELNNKAIYQNFEYLFNGQKDFAYAMNKLTNSHSLLIYQNEFFYFRNYLNYMYGINFYDT